VPRSPVQRFARSLTALAAVTCALAPRVASAQSGHISLDQFQPAPAGDSFFAVKGFDAGVGKVDFAAMAMFDYAHDPLVLFHVKDGSKDARIGALVSDQLFVHAGLSLGIVERLQVSLDFPIALVNKGENATAGGTTFRAPSGAAVGDLRAGLRLRLYGDRRGPFGIAVTGDVWFPSGNATAFASSGTVRGAPGLALGGWIGPVIWGANLGVLIQKGTDFESSRAGTSFTFGAGAAVSLLRDRLQIGPELYGGGLLDKSGQNIPVGRSVNLEGILGLKGRLGPMVLGAGAGPGFSSGLGTPSVRVVGSLAYAPSRDDHDHDGILDRDDACPEVPGLPNPDRAKNGCPPEDRDHDGILDDVDACPDVAGKKTDDPATNGCPDRDGDGIPDAKDACPDVAGVKSEDPKKNGCPPDRDGDGIIDAEDACPDVKGVPSDDPKKNGCPPDRDGDGIIDAEDACPDVKGVPSDDPKKNGCPPDTDGDGIPDAADACPTQPGKPDPDPKKNGCPVVFISPTKIEILDQVQFATASDVILPASDGLLTNVARILNDHPEMTKILVEGHTDNRGGKVFNKGLSTRRAASVKRWLVKHGVAEKRLDSKGFGEEVPIGDNNTDEGRQKNRRVEFKILQTSRPGEVVTVPSTALPPKPKAPPGPPPPKPKKK
jgi:outer membrane protein OmpA-like peptidoglycan-associated protein